MHAFRLCLVSLTAYLFFVAGTLAQQPNTKLPEGIKALTDLEYVPGGHERQKLDLYLPVDAKGPLPVVVWIHGGAWKQGSKDRCPAVPLATKGYAVASINYRLSQHAPFPAQIEDCKAAIRWLRAKAKNYQLDPEHIGVWGASAGGHLVALLGTTAGLKELEGNGGNLDQSSKVQAVVYWFGASDLRIIPERDTTAQSAIGQLLGGSLKDKKELAALASPVTHVTKDAAPFLIMHGDKDILVAFSQSELLEAALKKAGAEAMLIKVEGAGHGGPQFLNDENKKRIEDFLERHLKPTAK
jgi:acetyl esterase/lipase